jgi:DNA polymerase I
MNKTLLLVDGSSYLYRAFHAMPDLRNAQGEPTGAIYGVINMLRKLAHDYQPQYAACIFDVRGKTFRDELYPEYKAHRPSMPEDLAHQVEAIHDVVKAMGWPVVGVAGVEADDVIATMAEMAEQKGWKSIISTGDKDLAQLVTEQTTLVNTMSNETLTPEAVQKKFGVRPDQIVDYLMLVGDAVDNVPGVNKVGPKTAVKWLDQYASVDEIVAHAGDIKGAVGEHLRVALPQFELTRDLLTVRRNCDLSDVMTSFDDLLMRSADKETLITHYERFGFRSWLREITQDSSRVPSGDARVALSASQGLQATHSATANQAAQANLFDSEEPNKSTQASAHHPVLLSPSCSETVNVQPVYSCVKTIEEAKLWLEKITAASIVAFDTETTSLDGMKAKLVGFSLSIEPGVACYVPVAHRGPDAHDMLPKSVVLALFKPWFESSNPTKLLHHAKYDTHVLENEGIHLDGIAHDSMLEAYVLESHKSVSLHELSQRWLGLKGATYESICGKGANQIGFDEVNLELATHYACEDADFTLRLHQALFPQIAAVPSLKSIYDLECNVSKVLFEIERQGVLIDVQELAKQSHGLGLQLLAIEQKAYELAGQPFNLNSPKQLAEILFGQMKLPVVRKTPGGTPSTDEEVLTKLAQDYPLPQVLLNYRGLAKLKSTYTDKLPKMVNADTGRVHTHYSQASVITGRLSSSDPNLQNIPVRTAEGRQVRCAFIAAPGCLLVSADYSQIELRVMAHVSGDAGLQQAFAAGEDIHRATASEVFGTPLKDVTVEQRRAAKAINFGLIYGMGAFGLASNLGITRDAAQSYIDRYFARYPGVAQYMAEIKAKAYEQGWVETVFGRRLYFPDIQGSGARRAGAERAAINAPMQGTAADLIKMAMVVISKWLHTQNLKSKVTMQVHDELVLEVPESEFELIKLKIPELMCSVAQLSVPLLAEVGSGMNWEQAH